MLNARRASPAVLMASGTAASRLTGFARTAALATALGLSSLADAYNAAAALPTMLLVLVTGGTLSSALVPLLVRAETPDQRRRVAGSVLVLVGAATAVATVLLAVSSTALAQLLSVSAPAAERQQRTQLLADFMLLFSPQLFLLGLSVVAGAILTSEGCLARVGITPVLTNLVTLRARGATCEGTGGVMCPWPAALLSLVGGTPAAKGRCYVLSSPQLSRRPAHLSKRSRHREPVRAPAIWRAHALPPASGFTESAANLTPSSASRARHGNVGAGTAARVDEQSSAAEVHVSSKVEPRPTSFREQPPSRR